LSTRAGGFGYGIAKNISKMVVDKKENSPIIALSGMQVIPPNHKSKRTEYNNE
jgi:hypothetical protein